MSGFVRATAALKPSKQSSIYVAYFYAAILVLMLLAQLFTFEDFVPLLENYNFPGGVLTAHLVGGLIVSMELFSLPFLLRMDLSPLMRIFSMAMGWLVPAVWLLSLLWTFVSVNSVENVGILGSKVHLAPSWWLTVIYILLLLLSIWASLEIWPYAVKKKQKIAKK